MRATGTRRWTNFDRSCGVYIVGFGDHVKIGFSTSLGQRLRHLESLAPEQLKLHAILFGATLQQERALHRRFGRLRLKNELFRLASPLTDYIAAHSDWRRHDYLGSSATPTKSHALRLRGSRSRSGLPPYVSTFTAKGHAYFHFRRGSLRIRLRGEPWSAEFMAAYAAALDGKRLDPPSEWDDPTLWRP